jgi:CHASE3 domain sensor protein
MILFAIMMFVLIFMSGMFFGIVLTNHNVGNQSHWSQYALTVILGLLGAYYIVTIIGMIKRLV